MTYEEAIKHINVVKSRIRGGDEAYDIQRKEALNIATEASEKQTPKKPAKQWGDNVCPNCRTDTRCRVLMGWEKRCPACGQALDWE